MISHIIAGVYFHEDIVEGSATAALLALLMLIPFLFLRRGKSFRKVSNILVGLAGLFIVFTILKGSACPHYWEVALPFFLALGTLILGAARYSRERSFGRGLGWYLTLVLGAGFLWGMAWITDIRSVLTGERMTREAFRAQMIEQSEQNAAGQSATAE
jgi:hypothetical protein